MEQIVEFHKEWHQSIKKHKFVCYGFDEYL